MAKNGVIPFDMEDPRTRKRVLRHLDEIHHRTPQEIEILHYLETSQGWTDLDLNLTADTPEDLDRKVLEVMASIPPFHPCPAAPREMWLRMVSAVLVRYRVIRLPGALRLNYVVAECSETNTPKRPTMRCPQPNRNLYPKTEGKRPGRSLAGHLRQRSPAPHGS